MANAFQSSIPDNSKTYKKVYKGFKGVDFTSALTEVDDERSPDAVNMIGDYAGMPEKRTGYIDLGLNFDGQRINGIFPYVTPDSVKYLIVHAGTTLYRLCSDTDLSSISQPLNPASYIYIALTPSTPTVIYSNANNNRSSSFVMNGKLYILDGANYLVYDGTTCEPVENNAYVPTTQIGGKPAGGGEEYEEVNLLSPYRINKFAGDGTSKEYMLDTTNISGVESITVEGTAVTDFTVDNGAGKVTFSTAPAKPRVTGEDNVVIKFKKTVVGYADRVNKCCVYTTYGINNDTRVFITGNPKFRNRMFYSKTNNPEYFPDTNYTMVGNESTAIMGFVKQYGELIVVKQKNEQDPTLFVCNATTDSNGSAVFTTTQGLVTVGAVSRYTFGNLYDDTLFFTDEGVFGLDTSSITLQKTTQLRSYYVNARLTKELGKYEAVACVFKNYYYLFLNGHVYIADAMQRNTNISRSFGYEWYYWDSIPARVAVEYEDELYFGTNDGRLCKFKTVDEYGMDAYSDEYSETGENIHHSYVARWCTKVDTLGDASSFKKILKQNIGVFIKPSGLSKGNIIYKGKEVKYVKTLERDCVFDFDVIDFDNFTFGDSEVPSFVPTNKKERKVETFQIILENDEIGTAMGLLEIHLKYVEGNRIKRG